LAKRHHDIRSFDSGEALLVALDSDVPDIIFLDLKMTGMSGLETLKHVRSKTQQALVILLTAYGTVEDAVEAMRLGAYDFLIKSVDLSGVEPVIERALEYLTLRRRIDFETQDRPGRYALQNVVSNSPSMKELVGQIQEMAQNLKTTVLLFGETGTGKEFVARVLHHNGPRAQGPFVGVNCTAIPQELFESELFGYERGAFTGANQRKPGLCEQAEGGTLFLDEIGDLNPTMQAKLLRVLQERSFKRLGNRDLRKEVAQGTFREDLFFRLHVVSLDLPPLRNRIEDIIPLSLKTLVRHSTDLGKDVTAVDPEAQQLLERYPYPGNIRELENIIERAVIFCRGRSLTSGDLPREVQEVAHSAVNVVTQGNQPMVRIEMKLGEHTLGDIENTLIEEVMRVSDFNKSLAAKHLGITRFALDRRLKKQSDS
jgi:two-component system response regulator AtoC